MAFNGRDIDGEPGTLLSQDRFREIELGQGIRRLTCHSCGFTYIYKFKTRQIRRKAEVSASEEQEIRSDHQAIFTAIPRFASIPETIKCKKCREILGIDTECIF